MPEYKTYKIDEGTYQTVVSALKAARDEAQHIADTTGNASLCERNTQRAMNMRYALIMLAVQREDDD